MDEKVRWTNITTKTVTKNIQTLKGPITLKLLETEKLINAKIPTVDCLKTIKKNSSLGCRKIKNEDRFNNKVRNLNFIVEDSAVGKNQQDDFKTWREYEKKVRRVRGDHSRSK